MNHTMDFPQKRSATKITPEAWDEIRSAFHHSILVDTPLASLAQNIEGCAWVLQDADEKPSAYVDLCHADVVERLRIRGLSPARFDDLVDILRGTLDFDQSLGAMLPSMKAPAAEKLPDGILRNLERLGIPAGFPISLCAFAPGTHSFCREQGMVSLGDFLIFARRASRAVVVGGEFRDVMNAIAHIDESTLARFLPFRVRSTGLHLVEAIALLVRPLDLEQRIMISRHGGVLPESVLKKLHETRAYFSTQLEELRLQHKAGMPLARCVVSLDDLSLESAVCAVLGVMLGGGGVPVHSHPELATKSAPEIEAANSKKLIRRGMFGSLWPWRRGES
jgi:hypothetical protein